MRLSASLTKVKGRENGPADGGHAPSRSLGLMATTSGELHAFADDPVPPEFRCPLTGSIMENPVTIASGQTYERSAIEYWFALGNRTCPQTQRAIPPPPALVPDQVLKEAILDWAAHQKVAENGGGPGGEGVEKEGSASIGSGSGRLAGDGSFRQSSQGRAQFRGLRLQELREKMVRGSVVSTSHDSQTSISTRGRAVSVTDLPIAPRHPGESESSTATSVPSQHSWSGSGSGSCGSSRGKRGVSNHHQGRKRPVAKAEDPEDSEILASLKQAASREGQQAQEGIQSLRSFSRVSGQTRRRMAQLGIVPVAVFLLKSDDKVILEHAVTTLLNLALETALKRPIAVAGALPLLLELVLYSSSPEIVNNALGAISNLCVCEENRLLLSGTRALPHFLQILQQGELMRTKKDAAVCLFNLSLEASIKQELIDLGAVEVLVDMLEIGTDLEDEVVLLLYSLTKAPQGCERILAKGAVSNLAAIVEVPMGQAQANALAALLALAKHSSEGLEAVQLEVVIPVLAVLAENGKPRCREKASALLKVIRNG